MRLDNGGGRGSDHGLLAFFPSHAVRGAAARSETTRRRGQEGGTGWPALLHSVCPDLIAKLQPPAPGVTDGSHSAAPDRFIVVIIGTESMFELECSNHSNV